MQKVHHREINHKYPKAPPFPSRTNANVTHIGTFRCKSDAILIS